MISSWMYNIVEFESNSVVYLFTLFSTSVCKKTISISVIWCCFIERVKQKKVVFGNEPVFILECQRILVIKIYSTTI
jgi:hypothetical protein